MIVNGGLTPALVPPIGSGIRKHTGEIARVCGARTLETRTCVRVRPGVTTIGRSEHKVVTSKVRVTAILVHTGNVDVAVTSHVTGDLNVTNERCASRNLYR